MRPDVPERTILAPGLEISRIIAGLWQVADMEKSGDDLDIEAAARHLGDYAAAGFDTFDMADHYGSSEIIAGRCLAAATGGPAPVAMTKWVPEPGDITPEAVRAGVEARRARLGVRAIDLLQFHWWQYEHPGYIDAMLELDRLRQAGLIRHLGLTNFNTDHVRVLLGCGIPIVSNQVSFSLLDRRAAGAMSEICRERGVRILAFGTLAGGFLSERWLGRPEPTPADVDDWSKMKYKRFIDAAGGWDVFQGLLEAVSRVARRHGASIANVATRWVLDHEAVAGVIVGVRLGEREHRADNLGMFRLALDRDDRRVIDEALARTTPIPGDCGDEYRRPPFLTASGDLSHHLATLPPVYPATPVEGRAGRARVDSSSMWEPVAGYSRAYRAGNRILVSGTTATHGAGSAICKGDPAGQAVYILDKIAASLAALGGGLADVVRTRIYLRDRRTWEAVARVHGRYFAEIRPANTLIEVSGLVGDYDVEIEAEAELDGRPAKASRSRARRKP